MLGAVQKNKEALPIGPIGSGVRLRTVSVYDGRACITVRAPMNAQTRRNKVGQPLGNIVAGMSTVLQVLPGPTTANGRLSQMLADIRGRSDAAALAGDWYAVGDALLVAAGDGTKR